MHEENLNTKAYYFSSTLHPNLKIGLHDKMMSDELAALSTEVSFSFFVTSRENIFL